MVELQKVAFADYDCGDLQLKKQYSMFSTYQMVLEFPRSGTLAYDALWWINYNSICRITQHTIMQHGTTEAADVLIEYKAAAASTVGFCSVALLELSALDKNSSLADAGQSSDGIIMLQLLMQLVLTVLVTYNSCKCYRVY